MSPADKNIAIFSEQKNLPRFFAKRRKIFRFHFIKCWKVCNPASIYSTFASLFCFLRDDPDSLIAGFDIGYVPAGPDAFFRWSGQFGPQQLIFYWPADFFFFFFFFF